MKRMTALLLSLAMLLVLCACGGETGTPTTETPAGTTPVVESPQTGGEPTAEEVKGVTIPSFTINVNGTDITNETMAEYPVYQVQATSVNSAGTELQKTVQGYDTVNVQNQSFRICRADMKYALMPVWMLSTKWNGQNFLFAMNGQTGKLIGDLPVDKGKYLAWFAGIALPLMALILGGWFLL